MSGSRQARIDYANEKAKIDALTDIANEMLLNLYHYEHEWPNPRFPQPKSDEEIGVSVIPTIMAAINGIKETYNLVQTKIEAGRRISADYDLLKYCLQLARNLYENIQDVQRKSIFEDGYFNERQRNNDEFLDSLLGTGKIPLPPADQAKTQRPLRQFPKSTLQVLIEDLELSIEEFSASHGAAPNSKDDDTSSPRSAKRSRRA